MPRKNKRLIKTKGQHNQGEGGTGVSEVGEVGEGFDSYPKTKWKEQNHFKAARSDKIRFAFLKDRGKWSSCTVVSDC